MLPHSPHYSRTTRPFRSLLISRPVISFVLRRRTLISYMEQSICWNMDCLWQKFSRFMKTPLCLYARIIINPLFRGSIWIGMNVSVDLIGLWTWVSPFLFALIFSSLSPFLPFPTRSVCPTVPDLISPLSSLSFCEFGLRPSISLECWVKISPFPLFLCWSPPIYGGSRVLAFGDFLEATVVEFHQ